jgi:hypothetical protein
MSPILGAISSHCCGPLTIQAQALALSRCAEFRTCYFPLDDLNSFFSRVLEIVPKEKKRSKRKGPL